MPPRVGADRSACTLTRKDRGKDLVRPRRAPPIGEQSPGAPQHRWRTAGEGSHMSRIYLVDDHVLVRQALGALLQAAGHSIAGEAGDITPALTGIQATAPELLLLDLQLGDRSGLELLAELDRRRLACKVIIVSVSRRARDLADAMRLGARGYVFKDAGAAEMLAAIDVVACGGRYLGVEEADAALRGLTEATRGAAQLTPRERQVLALAAHGRTSTAIGAQMHLSPKTVDTYRHRAMAKLGLDSIPAAVRWAIREGLMTLDDD
jgi:DNA-binding NarL/FixJ family response regulator